MKFEELEDRPATGLVESVYFLIPLPISFDLWNPKVSVGLDAFFSVFPIVAMPKGSVYKNHQPVLDKGDVGLAGEVSFVAAVPDTSLP